LFFVVLVAIVFQWRPSSTNKLYARSAFLDPDVEPPPEDLEERLIESIVSGFTKPEDTVEPSPSASLSTAQPHNAQNTKLMASSGAEEWIGQQETAFRTGSQKKEAVIVTATETVGTQYSLYDSMVSPDACFEVANGNQLIRLRHSRQEGVQFLL
uniref:SH2 domain-containing protein n=1 Tax=Schistocephalus solidus TaxID=70667 RepID=A0A183TSW5_SCHSO